MIGYLLGLGAGGALLWWYYEMTVDNNNSAEGMGSDVLDTSTAAAVAGELASAIGWPYWYGQGTPATPWSQGSRGVDCSGFVQMALVRLGRLASSAPDRSAAGLAAVSDPIDVGLQQPGDMAYYPGHVAIVVGDPDVDGHSAVMSADGHATTTGNVAGECVKVHGTARYRGDFVCYMRLKPGIGL